MLCPDNPEGASCVTNQGTDCGNIQKYCYNNLESNCDIYGGLYQWTQAMCGSTDPGIQGICPTGWSIPTDTGASTGDLGVLVAYLGSNSASKLAGNDDLWTSGNLRNSADFNTTGFMALPAGLRYSNGSFYNLGSYAFFWSSSEYYGGHSWLRLLLYDYTEVDRDSSGQVYGLSVRCLKN